MLTVVTGQLIRVSSRLLSTTMAASKRAVVLVADGSEEMEAVITIDVLRRSGIDVVVASVGNTDVVNCSRGVKIVADTTLASLTGDFDVVVLPGGE